MASDFSHGASPLGIPTLYEIEEGTSTATYPHLITRAGFSIFQRTCIDVRVGPPEVDICNDTPHQENFVQHPEPFDADGTLSMACRTLLVASVKDVVRRCSFQIQRCLVWSPTSCSYVEPDGTICEVDGGVALAPRIAFEAARLAAIVHMSNFLKPGTVCTLVSANDKNKDAERLVVVLEYVGAFPHARVSEGYWVGTLDRLPFATIEVYKAADETFSTQPNLSNAAVVDRRALVVVEGYDQARQGGCPPWARA